VEEGEPPRREVEAKAMEGLWVAVLDRVPVGQRIAYRVRSGAGDSETATFRAGIASGEPFTFAMFGDTRTNHLVHWKVVNAMVQERVDFAIHTGDLVEFGVLRKEWERFFAIERPLMQSRPLIAAMGNHDVSTRGYFRRYFVTTRDPGARRYYVRDWGNVRVALFDTETEYREGSTQYEYMATALDQAAKRGMYMVLAIHEPPYSSGNHGSNLRVQRALGKLVRRYGVELVVAGHDHNYERTKLIDGAVYIVSGSAGAPIRPVEPRSFSAAVRLEPHYVLVDVGPTGLTLRAINLEGITFDTAIIKPNPPEQGPN
jgi:3',5'-cyclic AMP phosphodiesterase CpdA